MIAVISPAKSLDFAFDAAVPELTVPRFLPEAEQLINRLRKLNPKKLGKLMDISEQLAQLNFNRYHEFHTPFTPDNAKPAIMVFDGDVYQGLKARELDPPSLSYAQAHLRILSGLYGLLRPLDLIQPYRLEMGTSLAVSPSRPNLYKFWGDKITKELQADLKQTGGRHIVNLASQEYFKAISVTKLKAEVITCEFREAHEGTYRMVTFFAKKARGYMASFICRNQLSDPEDLRDFNEEGYLYNARLSEPGKLIFTRESK